MANSKYKTIVKEQEQYYSNECPIMLSAYAVLLDTSKNTYGVQLKLTNNSGKQVNCADISIKSYDYFENLSEEINNFQYINIDVASGDSFGTQTLIPLSKNVQVKHIEVIINNVILGNNSHWEKEGGVILKKEDQPQELMLSYSKEEIEAYRSIINPKMKYIPFQEGLSWMCSCGGMNYDKPICSKCGAEKKKVFQSLDKDYLYCIRQKLSYDKALNLKKQQSVDSLEKAIAIFDVLSGYEDSDTLATSCREELAIAKRKSEEVRIENERKTQLRQKELERKNKLHKIIIAVLTMIAVAVCAGFFIVKNVAIPYRNYNIAKELMEGKDYKEAITSFEALGDYKDSSEMIKECKLRAANALMESGAYADAIEAFTEIRGYSDSEAKIEECLISIKEQSYNEAITMIDNGQYEDAIEAFKSLEGFKDSEEKITECENEIKYQQAISMLSYENPIYDDNWKAKKIFEELGDYKDSKSYLSQLYLVMLTKHNSYYGYDKFGRVISDYNYDINLGFDDKGRIIKVVRDNGRYETNYYYDDKGRIARIDRNGKIYTREYEYNSKGQVTKRMETSPEGKVSTSVYEYSTTNDYTFVKITETVPANTYTVNKTHTLELYQGEYLVRATFHAYGNDTVDEPTFSYIWAPEHDPNEEFYHELYLMEQFF